MSKKFKIPKFTDRELANRLNNIRMALNDRYKMRLVVYIQYMPKGVELPEENPTETPGVKYFFDLAGQTIETFQLKGINDKLAVQVKRQTEAIVDEVIVDDGWTDSQDAQFRSDLPKLYAQLIALIQSELGVIDAAAALSGAADDSWTRYRDSQAAVVNSLQHATETLLIQASQKNAELEKARSERFEKLEADLRAQIVQERKELQAAHDQRLETLRASEKALAEKESAFNTKESHYVARQKQDEQLKQIQAWLNDWRLTKGTSRKRWPITTAYIVAMLFTGLLVIYATRHSYDVLKSADEILKLVWWQWAAIWVKSVFPLVAFVTFVVYFIRWLGDWARQHSEEEFRNRTRLVDIGRSSWLLEAVRDAQERNKEIPVDLMRELSRNLFATNTGSASEIHPQTASDLLLQGLTSVRLKASDGSEVEAKRGKK